MPFEPFEFESVELSCGLSAFKPVFLRRSSLKNGIVEPVPLVSSNTYSFLELSQSSERLPSSRYRMLCDRCILRMDRLRSSRLRVLDFPKTNDCVSTNGSAVCLTTESNDGEQLIQRDKERAKN